MGTWGTQLFDNDTAADLGLAIARSSVPDADARLLDALTSFDHRSDTWLIEEAMAAADIVARRQGAAGGQHDAYTREIDRWVAGRGRGVPAELAQAAVRAVAIVLANAESLAGVWVSRPSFEEWRRHVTLLRDRLSLEPVQGGGPGA